MDTTHPAQLKFYQKIGKLFYAVAAADKVVRKAEYDMLLDIVSSHWMNVDEVEDEFHSDAAFQIEIVFGWLDYNNAAADDCFEEFREFKKEHEHLFDDKRKKLIWKTAQAIADAFAGTNKSELVLLSKLKLTLNS
ncbi:hypothetical protein [Altibacter sp.]|uniref:hypothetical protein n=1 Tax=Altibacter sp. TaxID=2024823 RepID=UPI000C89BF58|nr:hypothetical protein [Altibacter sp.]MAP55106.1 hypothetical protein [Altibacter sp.]